MPDPALPRLDPERRERLAALGLELLALRADLATPAAAGPPAAGPGTARLALAGAPWPSSDPLLRGILAALGLRAEDVAPPPQAGRPLLQFGPAGAAPDALALPPLAQLRDAGAKRAAWPRLRALRARLRQDVAG